MSLHLFATPVECTTCGTVVDDPKVDRCPGCGSLLKERRTPSRIAGVERRYGHLRFLSGFLRFLGAATALVGGLVFFSIFGSGEVTPIAGLFILLGSLVAAVAMFACAAFFDVAIDVEENTRATFRVQQLLLAHLTEGAGDADPRGGRAAAPSAAVPAAVVPAAAPMPAPELAPAAVLASEAARH
jgi:hypothetical protein